VSLIFVIIETARRRIQKFGME